MEVRDETVIVVSRRSVAAVLSQRRRWRTWWPLVEATVVVDRGDDGMRWSLTGAFVGITDVTLVEDAGGVLVRYTMSVDPSVPGTPGAARALPQSPHGRRELADLRRQQAVAWKRVVWALKDELEGRGEPRMP